MRRAAAGFRALTTGLPGAQSPKDKGTRWGDKGHGLGVDLVQGTGYGGRIKDMAREGLMQETGDMAGDTTHVCGKPSVPGRQEDM